MKNSKAQVLKVRKFRRVGEKAVNKAQEESLREVGQPYFVARWEDKIRRNMWQTTGGAEWR